MNIKKWFYKNTIIPFFITSSIVLILLIAFTFYLGFSEVSQFKARGHELSRLLQITMMQNNRSLIESLTQKYFNDFNAYNITICNGLNVDFQLGKTDDRICLASDLDFIFEIPGFDSFRLVIKKNWYSEIRNLFFIILVFLILIVLFLINLLNVQKKLNKSLSIPIENFLNSDIHFEIFELNLLKNNISRLIDIEKTAVEDKSVVNLSRQVAHDIRSPISALYLLRNKIAFDDKEAEQLYEFAISRVNHIADDLLTKSKKSEVFIKENLSSLNEMNKSIEFITNEKKLTGIENQIELCFSSILLNPDNILNINMIELSRIISNLINNSIESFAGLKTYERKSVSIVLREYGSLVELTVLDNGCGIPEDIISQIGKKEISFGKNSIGNGLGLYSSIKFVESSGGRIDIKSKVNQGTQITITFPLSKLN